jgi:hypothetical protein
VESGALKDDPEKVSYWRRFATFLSRIGLTEFSAEIGITSAKIAVKANLRGDPTFVAQLQQRMAGHLGAFVEDVRGYIRDVVKKIRGENPSTTGVVLLVDSIEHIRGVFSNADEVQRSLENLFAAHAPKLHLPDVHAVYTVPPWLKIRYGSLDALYEPGGVQVLPSLKVRAAGTRDPFEPGLRIMRTIVEQREAEWHQLLTEEQLRRLSLDSGGHLRDLLRLMMDVIRRTTSLPASDAVLDRALSSARDQSLPVPNDDAVWLARIASSNNVELDKLARLPDLARFLDTHLVLCYRNGREWYDLHPLIRDTILKQADRIAGTGGS